SGQIDVVAPAERLRLASEHSGQIDVIAPAERLRREQTRISWIPPPLLQPRPKSTEPPVVGDPQKRPRRRLVRGPRLIPPLSRRGRIRRRGGHAQPGPTCADARARLARRCVRSAGAWRSHRRSVKGEIGGPSRSTPLANTVEPGPRSDSPRTRRA